MEENTNPICYFCNEATDADFYCHGCKEYICEDCTDIDNDPWGEHSIDDHAAAQG